MHGRRAKCTPQRVVAGACGHGCRMVVVRWVPPLGRCRDFVQGEGVVDAVKGAGSGEDLPLLEGSNGYGPTDMVQRIWSNGYGPTDMVQRIDPSVGSGRRQESENVKRTYRERIENV
jgi:hypothetical protein